MVTFIAGISRTLELEFLGGDTEPHIDSAILGLTCSFVMEYADSSGFNIQWFHNGAHVIPVNGTRFQVRNAGTTATFTFQPTYTRDSGEFQRLKLDLSIPKCSVVNFAKGTPFSQVYFCSTCPFVVSFHVTVTQRVTFFQHTPSLGKFLRSSLSPKQLLQLTKKSTRE